MSLPPQWVQVKKSFLFFFLLKGEGGGSLGRFLGFFSFFLLLFSPFLIWPGSQSPDVQGKISYKLQYPVF